MRTTPTSELMYIGLDRKPYATAEALRRADQAWMQTNMPFIGFDGKPYVTSQTLETANRAYMQEIMKPIVIKQINKPIPIR